MEGLDAELEIRKATPGDALAIWMVTRLAYAPYRGKIKPEFTALRVTVATIRREIRSRSRVYGVAVYDGRIVGTIRYRRWKRHLGLSRLAVLPDYQGRGIGKRLVAWAEEQARRLGVPEVRGEVRAALPHLYDYYCALGFESFARRSGRGYRNYLIAMRKRVAPRTAPAPPFR